MLTFFETADIARQARVSTGLVRRQAAQGKIEVAAVTLRGSRLFRPKAVRRYLAERKTRRAARARKSARR
jgi:hypothetical protein